MRRDGPLTIRMVTEYAYPTLGGISEHVHNLSCELVERGHDVTIVVGGNGRSDRLAAIDRAAAAEWGYRTRRIGRSLPIPMNGSIARITALARPARQMREALHGADVVHAQGLVGPLLPLLAAAVSEAPVTVGTFHTYVEGGSHWGYRLGGGPVRRILSRLDRRIAVSHACVDGLIETFPGTYDVIPNGVDCERFHPLAEGAGREVPPHILFVGRLEPRNALADLLRAGAELAAEGREFVIQVAGDGPTRARDERLAHRLGLADRVEWLGLIHDDLPERYRRATLLAAPCTLASFGVILVEALASGTPIVCADNVGFRQVITDDVPGTMVPMRDASAMAGAIGHLLDDRERRREWARRGRAIAVARYEWRGVAARVEDLYLDVLAAGRPALQLAA